MTLIRTLPALALLLALNTAHADPATLGEALKGSCVVLIAKGQNAPTQAEMDRQRNEVNVDVMNGFSKGLNALGIPVYAHHFLIGEDVIGSTGIRSIAATAIKQKCGWMLQVSASVFKNTELTITADLNKVIISPGKTKDSSDFGIGASVYSHKWLRPLDAKSMESFFPEEAALGYAQEMLKAAAK